MKVATHPDKGHCPALRTGDTPIQERVDRTVHPLGNDWAEAIEPKDAGHLASQLILRRTHVVFENVNDRVSNFLERQVGGLACAVPVPVRHTERRIARRLELAGPEKLPRLGALDENRRSRPKLWLCCNCGRAAAGSLKRW